MDDLTTIKGIGKVAADKLAAAGITTFEQLAHNAVAGQHGVKAEWIAAGAARLPNERPEDRPDASGAPGTGSPSASADPFGDASAGTNSTDSARTDPATEALVDEALDMLALQLFEENCPRLYAAVTVWRAANREDRAPIIRIVSKREGFRRCRVAHPKAATDHGFDLFTPAELERLLVEPMLIVELV